MTGLSDKVLEKIKSGQTKPKPRWRFLLLRYLVLAVISLAIIVSAASVSLIIHLVDSFDLGILFSRPGWFRLVLASFPYAWLLVFLSVTVVGVAEFIRTRHGYRYRLLHVASGFAILVLALGGTTFALGGGGTLENYLEEEIPAYGRLMRTPQKFWLQPEEGLISGEIIMTNLESKEMEIRDWEGKTWNVDYSEALWRGQAENLSGAEAKIIGEIKEDGKFDAEEVRPWIGRGKVQGAEKKRSGSDKNRKSKSESDEHEEESDEEKDSSENDERAIESDD